MTEPEQAAAAWYAELRRGSSITWSEHLATELADRVGDGPPVRVDAAHLELVRRLAARVGGRQDFAELADRIIATPAFGRGRVEIPLLVPGSAPATGSPAMLPERVPAGELLRVAVPVLATLLGDDRVDPQALRRGRRRRAPRVVVHGNPGIAQPVRAALAAAGVREGGRGATHIVLVPPLEAAVFSLWTARVQGGVAVRWRRLWERLPLSELPFGIDPAGLIDDLAGRVKGDRIHLVVADSPAAATARAGELLEVDLTVPTPFTWAEVDLARRLNQFNAARLGPAQRAERAETLFDLLRVQGHGASGTPAAPAELLSWAASAATGVRDRLAERVQAGGYAVHGDLEEVGSLVGAAVGAGLRTGPAATLYVAVEAIARILQDGHR